MAKYAAFLRGINLGRRRRVSGADLRSRFEALGFEDVDTFRTSGNVIFDAQRESAARTTGRIEKGLAGSIGFEVAIFLRSATEVRAIAEHRPFSRAQEKASGGKLQVLMLPGRPGAAARRKTITLATDDDRLAFGDRELYWLPSGGMRDSALDLGAVEELVGPPTMRTKGTIEALVAKYFSG